MQKLQKAYDLLNVGDYVAYQPSFEEYTLDYWKTGVYEVQTFNPSKQILWRVYKKEDNEIVLICSETVGELALGGEIGYARAVKTLNELAAAHVNPVFAKKACTLGYTAKTVEELPTPILWRDVTKRENRFLYADKWDKDEVIYLTKQKLLHSFGRVWLASRNVHEHRSHISVAVNCLLASGKVAKSVLYVRDRHIEMYGKEGSCGVRVKVFLKKDLLLASGIGTEEQPYELMACDVVENMEDV